MAFTPNDNGKNALLGGLTGVAVYVSLHTATPDATGSNQSSAARQAVSWSTSAGATTITTAENFTGGASNGAVAAVGLWSAASGGTFYGYLTITGDAAFNAAGEYTLDDLDLSI